MRVLVAPDSFKGTVSAPEVAAALRRGWLRSRPHDDVAVLPMADGGEGTLEVVRACIPGSTLHDVRVLGPGGPLLAPWLLCPDGTAVVELALASGLPLLTRPNPLDAHTLGFGELLAHAAGHPRVRRIVAALGGSASTDGGCGALAALGVWFRGSDGLRVPLGGRHLRDLVRIDVTRLRPPPSDGVFLLVDVDAPLLGPRGAAHQFGPQKGAAVEDVAALEAALARLAMLAGRPSGIPGDGAAGGTAYGLAALWGAQTLPGAETVGRLTGLPSKLAQSDVVVTGEGCLDPQSFRGKVVGSVVREAARAGIPAWACVGRQDAPAPLLAGTVSLTDLAGTSGRAMSEPLRWLEAAGERLARAADRAPGRDRPTQESA